MKKYLKQKIIILTNYILKLVGEYRENITYKDLRKNKERELLDKEVIIKGWILKSINPNFNKYCFYTVIVINDSDSKEYEKLISNSHVLVDGENAYLLDIKELN